MKDLVARFGDFADQMESLFEALIPFKEAQRKTLLAQKEEELAKLSAWYDARVSDLDEELSILREHKACMEPPPDPERERAKQELQNSYASNILTPEERLKAQELLGVEPSP